MNRPTGPIRASLATVQFSSLSSGSSVRSERNFSSVKSCPPRPTRVWRKFVSTDLDEDGQRDRQHDRAQHHECEQRDDDVEEPLEAPGDRVGGRRLNLMTAMSRMRSRPGVCSIWNSGGTRYIV